MYNDDYLYNVKYITVKCKCECENDFLDFAKNLKIQLQLAFPEYFVGIQLYQSKIVVNSFILMECYKNIPDKPNKYEAIIDKIDEIYKRCWKYPCEIKNILSFVNAKKILSGKDLDCNLKPISYHDSSDDFNNWNC